MDYITPKAPPVDKDDHVKHNMFISVKIKQTVAALNLLQDGYPFNKVALIADRKKLPQMQSELSEKLKKEQNRIYSLEKTLSSLYDA